MCINNILSLFLLLGLGMAGVTCQRGAEPAGFLYNKTWLHAVEEDSAEVTVYRPNTYAFPPSRGRTGFSLDADGTFRLLSIAPTDGLEEHPGSWKMVKKDYIKVTFAGNETEDFYLQIISASPEVLKTKRVTQIE